MNSMPPGSALRSFGAERSARGDGMPTVENIDVAAYTIPTDGPESDGTLEWGTTTLVLVQARAATVTGIGWTYGPAATAGVVADVLTGAVRGRSVHDLP